MQIIAPRLIYALVISSVFLSGLTIAAPTGRGFIVLPSLIMAAIAAVHICINFRYRTTWLLGLTLLVFICLLNGSRLGSLILIISSIVLAELLRNALRQRVGGSSWWSESRIIVITALLAGVALTDLIGFSDWDLWADQRLYGGDLSFPRLKLWFSEPSYLGMFVALFYWRMRKASYSVKFVIAGILILTQSFYAICYLIILFNQKRALMLLIVFGLVVSSVYLLSLQSESIFLINSGLIRLVGLLLFANAPSSNFLIGNGIGAGDVALLQYFDAIGVDTANGFLFSFIYDVGLLGLIAYFACFARTRFDVFHLFFLLLNLGAGSFLIPVLICLTRADMSVRVSKRNLLG